MEPAQIAERRALPSLEPHFCPGFDTVGGRNRSGLYCRLQKLPDECLIRFDSRR